MKEWLKLLKKYVADYNGAIKNHLPEEIVRFDWNNIFDIINVLKGMGVDILYIDDINEGIISLKVTLDILTEDILNA